MCGAAEVRRPDPMRTGIKCRWINAHKDDDEDSGKPEYNNRADQRERLLLFSWFSHACMTA